MFGPSLAVCHRETAQQKLDEGKAVRVSRSAESSSRLRFDANLLSHVGVALYDASQRARAGTRLDLMRFHQELEAQVHSAGLVEAQKRLGRLAPS